MKQLTLDINLVKFNNTVIISIVVMIVEKYIRNELFMAL